MISKQQFKPCKGSVFHINIINMSFEVFSLGTSGMMPLPGRFLTSALLRREGKCFLFDCGEGTQVSLKLYATIGITQLR